MNKFTQNIKRFFNLFGLEIRRLQENQYHTATFFPYIKKIELAGVSFDFFVGDTDAAHWYDKWYPNLLAQELIAIKKILNDKNPRTLVDIGAHHGFSTVFLAKAFPKAKIIAIEPNQINFNLLQMNRQLNNCQNIEVHHKLLSDKTGKLIKLNTDASNSYVSFQNDNKYDTMESISLDELIQEPVDFIKVDVEGFEHNVLKGAQQILKKYHPILEVEIHPKGLLAYHSDVQQLEDFLKLYYSQYYLIEESHTRKIESITSHKQRTNVLIQP